MLYKVFRRKHFFLPVFILFGFFCTSTLTAYAQYTQLANSLVVGAVGAGTDSSISCKKGSITKGLQNIFGSGGNSDAADQVSDSADTLTAADQAAAAADSQDGTLDSTLPDTTDTTTDPTLFSGQDLGSSTNLSDAAAQAGDASSSLSTSSTTSNAVPVTDKNSAITAAQTTAQTKKLTCTDAIERAASQTILKQLTATTINWVNHGFQGGSSLFPKDPASMFKGIADQTVRQFASSIGFDLKNYPFGRSVVQSLSLQLGSSFEQQNKFSLDAIIAKSNPGMNHTDFENDFGNGGWNAFVGQFNTENNPVGFDFAAQSELASRVENNAQTQDLKDQLNRNQGFLDLKKCVSPANYDPTASADDATTAALTANAQDAAAADALAKNPNDPALIAALAQADQASADANKALSLAQAKSTCTKWETQTPGSAVSASLNKALGSTFDQLEFGQNLNTDLTAVFNALTNQLIQTGLSSLSNSLGSSSTSTKVTYTNNSSYVPNVSVDGSGGMGTNFLNAGEAYQTNIFNLDPSGKDPNNTTLVDSSGVAIKRINLVGIINREKQLIQTNEEDAQVLADKFGWTSAQTDVWIKTMQARDPNYTNLLGKEVNMSKRLIPAIYQLDFCIPGPHPGWQTDTQNSLKNFLNDPTTFPKSASDSDLSKFAQKNSGTIATVATAVVAGAVAGSVVPGIGTAIGAVVGLIVGFVLSHSSDSDKKNETIFRPIIERLLGVSIDSRVNRANFNGHDNSSNGLTQLSNEYITALAAAYKTSDIIKNYGISPVLIADDTQELANIPTYTKAITANNAAIANTQSIVGQLMFLGQRIKNLQENTNNLDGYPSPAPKTYEDYQAELATIAAAGNTRPLTGYERELKRINDIFNLIAPDLVSSDDITAHEATLNNITNKVETLAGNDPQSDLNQCISDVNQSIKDGKTKLNADGAALEPMGRIPFPFVLSKYIPVSLINKLPTSISFLPDYYYGNATTGRSAALQANPSTKEFVPQFFEGIGEERGVPRGDPSKTIENNGAFQINVEQYPYALAGLEYISGIY